MNDAIMSALGSSLPSVRAVAARCLAEFLHYAVKCSCCSCCCAAADSVRQASRASALLDRMLELGHAAPLAIGAAAAFNAASHPARG